MASFWRRSSVPAFFIVLSIVGWCARSVAGAYMEVQYQSELEGQLGHDLGAPAAVEAARPTTLPEPEPLSEEQQRARTLARVRAAMGEGEPLPARWPPAERAVASEEDRAAAERAERQAMLVAGAVGGLIVLVGAVGALLMLRSGGAAAASSPAAGTSQPGFTDEDVLRAMREIDDR